MSEARRRAKAYRAAADPEREPRQPWRWDHKRAWWIPAGDWSDDHSLVVMKRGRDPKWYARAKRVGAVAATDTADQAKVALESWVAMVSVDADHRRERSRLGEAAIELDAMLAEARGGDPSRLQRAIVIDEGCGSTATVSWLVARIR